MPSIPSSSSSRNHGGENYGVHHQGGMPEMQSEQQSHPELGNLIRCITPREILGLREQMNGFCTYSWIAAEKCYGTYNWLNEKTPSILTPGKPPVWTPLSTPPKFTRGSEGRYHDQDVARYPLFPLEPAIEAVHKENPDFPLAKMDIISSYSTLRALLGLCFKDYRPFRILVTAIEDSCCFTMHGDRTPELNPRIDKYGRAFAEANTTWDSDIRGSESHHRVMGYVFAEMRLLVSFEADGYLPDLVPQDERIEGSRDCQKQAANTQDALLWPMRNTRVSSQAPMDIEYSPDNGTSTLDVVYGDNSTIPQCAIFDLKTRPIQQKPEDNVSEHVLRLWLAQIPNLVVAYHDSGAFTDIRVHDVRDFVNQWEEQMQPSLIRFACILRLIVNVVNSHPARKLEIVYHGGETPLELREQTPNIGRPLPPEVEDYWVPPPQVLDSARGIW